MYVQLLVTKMDFNRSNIEREFRDLGIRYNVQFAEDNPDLISAFNIRHSPNILVDGRLAFQYQPSESELKRYFKQVGVLH